MTNTVFINWWTGAMVVLAIVLFAISLALKMQEWGIIPHRKMTWLARRPWFDRLLLLFCVCGIVQYGATKGTGGGNRSADDDAQKDVSEEATRVRVALHDEAPLQVGEITNLCFTGICLQTNGVALDVAWPTNMFVNGTILDVFAKHCALTNDWRWVLACSIQPGNTNLSLFVDMLVDLEEQTAPVAMYFKVQDRNSCARSMADSDGDGIPDVYELHNGTNPYVRDAGCLSKLMVGPTAQYATLDAALAASTNYSVIALLPHVESSDEMVVMPSYPVMVMGPEDGYAVFRSSANIAAVLMDAGQGSDTLFRNLYVVLEARHGFQSAFWIGGNLPWNGSGASPTFENVRVRALYPNVLHFGWHYYCDDGGASVISNCVMNAAGSSGAIGVYAYDGPEVGISDSVFVNFPTNTGCCATWTRSGTNVVTEVASGCTNLSWAGYSLNATYSDTVDSDGDGLSDYQEIHVHDTDPWLADSDGDGLSDSEEEDAVPPTNPRDVYSFFRRVAVITTASDSLEAMTNYVAWGVSGTGWETNGLAAWRILPSTNVYEVSSPEGPMHVKAYRDLNRNGQYDENADILLVEQVPPQDAVSTFVFSFGDIDGDGISDVVERQDGSNPYDGKSFRLRVVVTCLDSDRAAGATNYLGIVGDSRGACIAFSESGALTIDEIVTNGTCVVSCLRDFNGNCVYDEGVDILYSRMLTKSDNGKTAEWSVGDADGDGQLDSVEVTHGTSPTDPRNYCFSLAFVERGIFATTNQLTAEVLFGTNVLVGPIVMTNRTWECDLGHLVTSNREVVVAHFWDDANSNGVCDAEECRTSQSFSVSGHENGVTNTLVLGTFDRDNDGMLDSWEMLHEDAGLSPTNAVDAFIDSDSDGLINLHEYWADCDPNVYDGTNTAVYAAVHSVDDRIFNKTASISWPMYRNFKNNIRTNAPPVVRENTNCWAHSLLMSRFSLWCSDTRGWQDYFMHELNLVTPQHAITATHCNENTNSVYMFVGISGNWYARTICGKYSIPNTDITVCLLNEPVPTDDICVTPMLPTDYGKYLGTLMGLPVAFVDQEKNVVVQEIIQAPQSMEQRDESLICGRGRTAVRSAFYQQVVGYDSGSPCYLLIGDQPVFLYAVHARDPSREGAGVAKNAVLYAAEIQAAMDELSDSFGYSRYMIERIDLSEFEPCRKD